MTTIALSAQARPIRPSGRRTTRARRRAFTLAVLFVLVAALVLVILQRGAQTQAHLTQLPGESYTVSAGDTLWEIADRYAGQRDVREMIRFIQDANGLDSVTIHPGQTLFIPAVQGTTIAGR